MLDIFIFALNAVMPIILLIALGYILKKKSIFSKEFLKIGNKTVFQVLLPALLFTNLAKMDGFSVLRADLFLYIIFAIILLFGMGLILTLFISDYQQKGVLLQCTFRSKIMKILRDIIHNPLILGVLAGILFVCIKPFWTTLPVEFTGFFQKFEFLKTAIDYLAKASTPVALLVLGGQFELSHIKGMRKQILLGISARLLFAPLIGIGGAVLLEYLDILHFDSSIYAAMIALYVTPAAVSSAVMAEEMNNDGALAGQLVVWTTLFSAFIIFLTIVLLRGLGLL